MLASKRERMIGLVTGVVLAALALDRVVVSPLMARRTRAGEDVAAAKLERQEAEMLFDRGARLEKEWDVMLAGGLKSDVPAAEGQALEAMGDWARDTGVTVRSMAPARVETQRHFQVSLIRASITGSMRTLSEFMWRVQTAQIPIRVVDMQIIANKEGTDDLMLQLTVSTLSLLPAANPPPGGGGARSGSTVASAAGVTSGRGGAR